MKDKDIKCIDCGCKNYFDDENEPDFVICWNCGGDYYLRLTHYPLSDGPMPQKSILGSPVPMEETR